MTKILGIKPISDDTFEILLLKNDVKRKFTVTRREVYIDSMNEYMSYFVAVEPEFYEVWGESLSLRKKISKAINRIRKENMPVLQSVENF